MKAKRSLTLGFAAAVITVVSSPALATFHLIQIEQVIAGVDGDTTAQAIQLRMRTVGQNQVQNARVVVWDAAGGNPIVVATFPGPVSNSAMGARILIASAGFAAHISPSAVADRTLTTTIPASYLAAGSLTFEDNFGTVNWRLSWGGASYTGPNTGSRNNDADGDFGPPVGGALPSGARQALQFKGTADAASTQNVNDYALTTDAAVFINNAGNSFTVGATGSTSNGGTNSQPGGNDMSNGTTPAATMHLCGIFGMVDMAALTAGMFIFSTCRRRRNDRAA